MELNYYNNKDQYDEYMLPSGKPRSEVVPIVEWWQTLSPEELQQYQKTAQQTLAQKDVTFGEGKEERVFPFDLIPRIIPAAEW